jgi:hypothetical protein
MKMNKKDKAIQQLTCNHPDRDFPDSSLICGYPLPCPWHTVIIDLEENPPTITTPATKKVSSQAMVHLKEIALILNQKPID